MADIIDKKPKVTRKAHVKDNELHMEVSIGPQQLKMKQNEPAIGLRHNVTLDIVKMDDVPRFVESITEQRDGLQENLVNMREQEAALEKLGAAEIGLQLDELIVEVKKIADSTNKKAAWTNFQRKLFKEKALATSFSQWQQYKQLGQQIAQAEGQLENAIESITTIEKALK